MGWEVREDRKHTVPSCFYVAPVICLIPQPNLTSKGCSLSASFSPIDMTSLHSSGTDFVSVVRMPQYVHYVTLSSVDSSPVPIRAMATESETSAARGSSGTVANVLETILVYLNDYGI